MTDLDTAGWCGGAGTCDGMYKNALTLAVSSPGFVMSHEEWDFSLLVLGCDAQDPACKCIGFFSSSVCKQSHNHDIVAGHGCDGREDNVVSLTGLR